jgi:O-methyltransferase domain
MPLPQARRVPSRQGDGAAQELGHVDPGVGALGLDPLARAVVAVDGRERAREVGAGWNERPILANVLHDWDDGRCVEILRNCGRAMASGGRILIVERSIPEHHSDVVPVLLSDINMLLVTGEKSERTPSSGNSCRRRDSRWRASARLPSHTA